MHDHSTSHPLLIQLPLSVSPFIHLPSAITLPYTYQTLPLALPPSSTVPGGQQPQQPGATGGAGGRGYITSPSGTFSTTPEAIMASCQNIISHLAVTKHAAEQKIKDWEKSIEDRELMEKRKIAPGYLDTGITILTPVKIGGAASEKSEEPKPAEIAQDSTEAEELDRMFGSMKM